MLWHRRSGNLDDQVPMSLAQLRRRSAIVVDELQRPRHAPSFARESGSSYVLTIGL